MFKILSIDGGGVRGIIPATILEAIEKEAGKPIYELFDLIVGTSTGALISLALTCPTSTGKPMLASEVINMYQVYSSQIFSRSTLHTIKTGSGLWGPKYDRSNFDRVANEIFGDKKMSDCLCHTAIPTYSLTTNKPYLINSVPTAFSDFYIKDAAVVSASAPTYFAPKIISSISDYYSKHEILVDAGIYANNPELIAIELATNADIEKDEIFILSIGTGNVSLNTNPQSLMNAGIIGWLKGNLIEMMIYGTSYLDGDITNTYPNAIRLEMYLPSDISTFDDASNANIQKLIKFSNTYVDNNKEKISTIVKRLTE